MEPPKVMTFDGASPASKPQPAAPRQVPMPVPSHGADAQQILEHCPRFVAGRGESDECLQRWSLPAQ